MSESITVPLFWTSLSSDARLGRAIDVLRAAIGALHARHACARALCSEFRPPRASEVGSFEENSDGEGMVEAPVDVDAEELDEADQEEDALPPLQPLENVDLLLARREPATWEVVRTQLNSTVRAGSLAQYCLPPKGEEHDAPYQSLFEALANDWRRAFSKRWRFSASALHADAMLRDSVMLRRLEPFQVLALADSVLEWTARLRISPERLVQALAILGSESTRSPVRWTLAGHSSGAVVDARAFSLNEGFSPEWVERFRRRVRVVRDEDGSIVATLSHPDVAFFFALHVERGLMSARGVLLAEQGEDSAESVFAELMEGLA